MPGGILSGAASGAQAGMVAGPYGAAVGAVIGGVLGALSYKPPVAPKLSTDKLDPVTAGQKDFLSQGEHLGDVGNLIQQANDDSNTQFQANITKFDPSYASTTGQIGAAGANLAGGKLPGGFVAPGPGGGALSAADLGMTSDDLVKIGAGQVGAGEKASQAYDPFNDTSTSTLLSPGALLNRRDQAGYYNTGLTNQAAIGKAAASAIDPFSVGVGTGLGGMQSSLRGLSNLGGGGGGLNGGAVGDAASPDGSMYFSGIDAAGDAAGGAADAAGSLGGIADVADFADI